MSSNRLRNRNIAGGNGPTFEIQQETGIGGNVGSNGRQQIGPFTHAANSASAGAQMVMCQAIGSDVKSVVSEYARWIACMSGSILGMAVNANRGGSSLGTATTYQVYINSLETPASLTLGLIGSAYRQFTAGTYTFNAGDEIEILYSGSDAITSAYTVQLWLMVNM
jgi:hypothetical protein